MNRGVHQMAIAADRRNLHRRAARRWMAAEAGREHRGRHSVPQLRWAVGAVLVHVGQYLQGASNMEIVPKPTA